MEAEDEEITINDSWKVISSYFQRYTLVHHHLSSFDKFVTESIRDIVDDLGDMEIQSESQIYKIQISNHCLGKPSTTEADGDRHPLLPMDARLRKLTYSANLCVDVSMSCIKKVHDDDPVTEETHISGLFIGKVPVMVRSSSCTLYEKSEEELVGLGECAYDDGGYFIIKGSEKVMIPQEKKSPNQVHVFKPRQPTKYSYIAEVSSIAENQNRSPRRMCVGILSPARAKGGSRGQFIRCTLPNIKKNIPIFIVFRALGIVPDQFIVGHICGVGDSQMMGILRPSLEEASPIQNQEVALDYIGKRGATVGVTKEQRIAYAKSILQKEMLPHVGVGEFCQTEKAYYLGYIVHRLLLCVLGLVQEDDRNHYGNKRVELAGPLLGGQFRMLFRKLTRDVRSYVQKCADNGKEVNLQFAFIAKTITSGLEYSLATGNWGQANAAGTRTGVSQALDRLTYASTLSHLRRLYSPAGYAKNLVKPRQVHTSQFGRICPTETPKGESCGLVKNLALMGYVTAESAVSFVLRSVLDSSITNFVEMVPSYAHGVTKVFLNGKWVGVEQNPAELLKELRYRRRMGALNFEVGVVRDMILNEIRIYTDGGRCIRPLFLVNNQKLLIKKGDIDALEQREIHWDDLVEKGFIEYIDAEEEAMTMTARNITKLVEDRLDPDNAYSQSYTHCEIHPSLILGSSASIIPFPHHNPAPRNTYQCIMGKQSMGMYATNYRFRMDASAHHVLYYPQKPLVTTRAMDHLHFRQLPAGTNAIVAINSSAYNQEDSIIMNQSSIDRGLFRSMSFRSYSDEERKMGTLVREKFGRPKRDSTKNMNNDSYDKLDEDGFAPPGTRVHGEDIIIGKTSPIDEDEGQSSRYTRRDHSLIDEDEGQSSRYTRRDHSTRLPPYESGMVDQVILTTNQDGLRFVKTRVRSVRIPQIGDKFSTRHGQKGTVGMTYPQEDMPWTISGITPDIIVNPHSFPSRMTMGELLECIMGKVASLQGKEGDATPFTDVTAENLIKALEKCGYHFSGCERMYNGETGSPLDQMISIGPIFYQRMKQMVDDKIHSRQRGPVTGLTRQPTEGRSYGGTRFGEMERDCAISHGAAHFLKERLFDVSDAYRVHVCGECGLMSIANLENKLRQCRLCRNFNEDIVQVHVPYAWKLLLQELMAMAIAPRMITKKEDQRSSRRHH